MQMAKRYKKLPSEILEIDGHLGYCINEVAYYYENQAMQEDGTYNYDHFAWSDREKYENQKIYRPGANRKLIKHIESEVRKRDRRR